MRNLNECQAEVFRRSEKRIKVRKQRRNHMLMACIPLVLCITVFGVFLSPGEMLEPPRDPGTTVAATGGLTENKSESFTYPIAKVAVSGLGFSITYTDAADVLPIFDRLCAYGSRGFETSGSADESVRDESENRKENTADISDGFGDFVNTGYTVTLVMHEGKKTEYRLTGNTLKNLTANQTYTLSQKQVNELKDLLGIPRQ